MCIRAFRASGWDAARTLADTADLLDALNHPCVVKVVDYTPDQAGATLTVTPSGRPIESEWTPDGPADVAAFMAEIADAVAYLHHEGLHLAGVPLTGLERTTEGLPLLADPRPWRRVGGTADRSDVASLGRGITRLLTTTLLPGTGWLNRIGGSHERTRAISAVARAAESGRVHTAGELASALRSLTAEPMSAPGQVSLGTATPSDRNLAAAEPTSTARIAASSLRSVERIVSSDPAKS